MTSRDLVAATEAALAEDMSVALVERAVAQNRHNPDGMSVYYGCSHYAFPQVVAQYVCRCGRIHTQHGARQVSKLPPGWHETSDLAGQPEPECVRCHKKTVARRKRALRTARGV